MPSGLTGGVLPLTTVLPARKYPVGRVQRGLTNWWPMDSTTARWTLAGASSTHALDIMNSQSGQDGTGESTGAAGGPPFDQGDPVYNFDGVSNSQFFTLASDPLQGGGLPSSLTAAFWVYLKSYASSDGGDPRMIAFSTDFVVSTGNGATAPNGGIDVSLSGVTTEAYSTQVVSLNTWTHVVVTVSGTTIKVYLNGVAATMNTGGDGAGGTAGIWSFGCRGSNDRIMTGKMADMMLFRGTALNAGEIAALYYSYFLPTEEMPAIRAASATALLATLNIMAKAQAAPKGSTSIIGRAAIQGNEKGSVGGTTSLSGLAITQTKIQGLNSRTAFLSAVAKSIVEARGLIAGASALAGRISEQAKSSMNGVFLMPVSGRLSIQSSDRSLFVPNAFLSAISKIAARMSGAIAGVVGLAGHSSIAVKGSAAVSFGNIVSLVGALFSAIAARIGFTGSVALGGTVTVSVYGQLVPFKSFALSGLTIDQNGNAIPGCTVLLFRTLDDVLIASTISDGNGRYSFPNLPNATTDYFVNAYLTGNPDIFGTTSNKLTAS